MGRTLEFAIRIAGRIERSVGTAFTNAQRQIDKLQGAANAMSNAVAVGSATVGGAAVKATKELLDLGGAWQTATNQVSAATGATGAELEELRDIMEAVYANNFGDGLDDIVDTLALVDNNMGNLPKEELQTATESAIALRDALGYDAEETIRAAEALRKNFGKSAEQAFGMIAAGAQNGLDYSGELLDTISEYSSQFAKLGFDANGMFHLLQSGADSTAWNLDKVGDAIKEFSIRAIDGSDTTVAAFQSLGFNAQTMMTTIAGGGDAANKAFYDILDSLLAVEDQVKRDSIGVSLFGTMWEDLGVEAMTALSQTSDAAYDAESALAQINAVKYNDLDSVLEGLRRKLELSMLPAADALYQSLLNEMPQLEAAMDEVAPILGELAGDFASDAAGFVAENLPSFVQFIRNAAGEAKNLYQEMKPLLNFLWEHKETVLGLIISLRMLCPVLSGVSTAIGAFRSAKTFLALLQSSGRITALTGAFKAFGKILMGPLGIILLIASALILLYKNWDAVKGWIEEFGAKASKIWEQFYASVEDAIDSVWVKFHGLGAFLSSLWISISEAVEYAKAIFSNVIDFLDNVFAGNWFDAWENIVNIFRNLFGMLSTLAMAPIYAVVNGFLFTMSSIGDGINKIWQNFSASVSNVITSIGEKFPIFGVYLQGWWQSISEAVEHAKNIFSDVLYFIEDVFNGYWSGAWEDIVNIFGNLLGMLSHLVKAPVNGVISVLNYLGSVCEEKWQEFSASISNAITSIGEKFPIFGAYLQGWWQSISAAVDNVKAIFNNIIDFINNVFAGNWTGAWQNIVNIFGNLFGMLGNLAKAPINAVISAINYIIGQINSLSFTVPDWVPGDLAGQTFGFALPTIPQLAKGGIATSATLAEIGEGSEPEAVLPLSKLAQLLKQYTGTNPPKDNKPTENGNSVIQFAPVFHFYGNVTKEEAVEAGRLSFAEFKRLYKQMKEEEKRKKFAPV